MNKQVNTLTPEQKRNLIKNTVFHIGESLNPIGFETLLDTILCEPSFIFNIVNEGLSVKCPAGFVAVDKKGDAIDYYVVTATEGKYEEEVDYKGILSNTVYTFQQCAMSSNTLPIYDAVNHNELMEYFTAPSKSGNAMIEPYTIDESSIIFNIPTYLFDKVTCKKGYISAGTGLPVDMLEECSLFDTEEERDQEYNKYMQSQLTPSKQKINIFDAIRMAASKSQFGKGQIG